MSFFKRGLSVVIRLNEGQDFQPGVDNPSIFSNGDTKLVLSGLRCVASIQSNIGGDTAFSSHALLQIWGMKPSDMAQLSTLGFDQGKIGKNNIQINAYNVGQDEDWSHPTPNDIEVFSGGIFVAHINYNAMPDVSLELECWATINQQVQAIPATSVQGSGDVAAMLQGICAASNPPVTFVNSGVTAKLSNPAYAGSQWQQIKNICCDAGICHTLQGDTLTIWPKDQSRDGVTITTGPDQGMVGYPEYTQLGLDVTMEFNPEVQYGRELSIVQASGNPPPIPGVPGTFWVNAIAHELSSEMPDGPWFTRVSVSKQQIMGWH